MTIAKPIARRYTTRSRAASLSPSHTTCGMTTNSDHSSRDVRRWSTAIPLAIAFAPRCSDRPFSTETPKPASSRIRRVHPCIVACSVTGSAASQRSTARSKSKLSSRASRSASSISILPRYSAQGKPYMFVAIDWTSKFAFVPSSPTEHRRRFPAPRRRPTGSQVLTHHGTHFTTPGVGGSAAPLIKPRRWRREKPSGRMPSNTPARSSVSSIASQSRSIPGPTTGRER